MDLQSQNIKVAFTDLHGQPKDMFERFNLIPGLIEREYCFENFQECLAWMEGYLKNAKETRKALVDGLLRTGDMGRMVKRRMRDAGLPPRLSPHSFRVATITDLLAQGVPLEDVQHLAGHADPRTTRLYDRRQRRVTRNIVERISI